MTDDGRERLFERYTDDVYSRFNSFDLQSYHTIAEGYAHLYDTFLPTNPEAEILDAGCGTGFFLFYLKVKGYRRFCGIDLSEPQLAVCRERVTDRVFREDGFDFLSTRRGQFDLIVMNDFIEHIDKRRIIPLLDLVRDALKPAGRLIIKTPNMGCPMGQWFRYIDFSHEVGFTEESIWQVLKLCGFREVSIHSTDHAATWSQRVRKRFRATIVAFVFGKCLNLGLPRIRSANLLVVADR